MPINNIDEKWLLHEITTCKNLISLDNHYYEGGQGARIGEILAKNNIENTSFTRMAIDNVPECGTTDEVLDAHNLSVKAIFNKLNEVFSGVPTGRIDIYSSDCIFWSDWLTDNRKFVALPILRLTILIFSI